MRPPATVAKLLRSVVLLAVTPICACSDDATTDLVDAAADGNVVGEVDAVADAPEDSAGFDLKPDQGADSGAPLSFLTVEPIAGRPNWNDYGAASNPAVDCSDNDEAFGVCRHYGAMRRVRVNQASCEGLVMKDDLGAFDWTCDAANADAVFVGHLRPDRGLADLVTSTGWRPNRVTLSGRAQAASAPSQWWNNPIRDLPANAEACVPSMGVGCEAGKNLAQLQEPGAVYVAAADQRSRGYTIAADGISVVTLGRAVVSLVEEGFSLVYPPTVDKAANYAALFAVRDRQRIWIEGSFDRRAANVSTLGLWAVRMRHSHVRNTGWGNFGNASIELWDCHGNTFSDLRIQNAGYALYIEAKSSLNVFTGVRISSGRSTITFQGQVSHNIVVGASVVHNAWSLSVSGRKNLLANLLVREAERGVYVGAGSEASLAQAALLDLKGAALATDGASVAFSGKLLVGPSQAGCAPAAGTDGAFDADCKPMNQPTTQSEATLTTGVSAANSLVGKVTADDANPADLGGAATYRHDLAWWPLQNLERAWGAERGPSAGYERVQCTPENPGCVIFDWTPRVGDTALLNATGRSAAPAGPFVPGQSCPPAASGAEALFDASQAVSFLRSAIEVLGDGIGNDNGLCESHESCLYAPNFGAYQGHGPLATCRFDDGANGAQMRVQGVTLYGFEMNGR